MAALVDTDDGAAVVVGDVRGAEQEEVGDGASSVSLSPSPSSWLKVVRMPAFLQTNLTKSQLVEVVHWLDVKCQKSIRLNFCRSVPPEFLRSFFLIE